MLNRMKEVCFDLGVLLFSVLIIWMGWQVLIDAFPPEHLAPYQGAHMGVIGTTINSFFWTILSAPLFFMNIFSHMDYWPVSAFNVLAAVIAIKLILTGRFLNILSGLVWGLGNGAMAVYITSSGQTDMFVGFFHPHSYSDFVLPLAFFTGAGFGSPFVIAYMIILSTIDSAQKTARFLIGPMGDS